MNRPWMPWYVADFVADTQHLDAAQTGAYMMLLGHYWLSAGKLPHDDASLARISRMTLAQWRKARPLLGPFFQDGWRHKRVEFELTEAARISAAGRKGGEASARSRRSRSNDPPTIVERPFNDPANDPPTNGQVLHSPPQSQREDSSLRSEEPRARRAVAPGWPADYREQFWREFPNKVGKADAFRKLDRLARSDKVAFPTLMLALGRYANKTDDRPFCNPATWINGERWSDEPATSPVRQLSGAPPRPGSKEDMRERTAHAYRKLGEYVDAHADEPGGSGGPGEANAGLLPFAKPA